jgi:hypothetical protein
MDPRRTLLTAALGFAQLEPRTPELRLLHRWLDTWSGLGAIAAGMHRAGWDLQLTEYGDGHWRATFFVTGQAHSIVGVGGGTVAGGAAGGVGGGRARGTAIMGYSYRPFIVTDSDQLIAIPQARWGRIHDGREPLPDHANRELRILQVVVEVARRVILRPLSVLPYRVTVNADGTLDHEAMMSRAITRPALLSQATYSRRDDRSSDRA